MVTTRPKTTHAKRLFSAAFASCAAAVAMAYSFSSGVHHNSHDVAGSHGAPGLLGGSPGDVGFDVAQNGPGSGQGPFAHGGGGYSAPGGGASEDGGSSGAQAHGSDGDGDHDDHDSGLHPNGENGLMILTDFVNGQGHDGKDGVSGGESAGGGAFSGSGDPFGYGDGEKGGPGAPQGGFGPNGGLGGGGGGGGGSHPSDDNHPGAGQPEPGGLGDGGPACLLGGAPDCFQPPHGDGPPHEHPGGSTPPTTFIGINSPGDDGPGGDDPPVTNLSATAPVPEPATWALLILGFGALGQVLRLRRRAVAV